ncbi:MAG: hypothetical protein J0M04_01740, partial [Verrucomicrobia bacterium]|nr:hypothetical protein [Verrucomicrobiota bacterium]
GWVGIGLLVICYWLLGGAGRFFIFYPQSTIFDLLGELGVLAVNLFGWGEVDLAGWRTEVRAPLDAD